jgi:hypothetical protein
MAVFYIRCWFPCSYSLTTWSCWPLLLRACKDRSTHWPSFVTFDSRRSTWVEPRFWSFMHWRDLFQTYISTTEGGQRLRSPWLTLTWEYISQGLVLVCGRPFSLGSVEGAVPWPSSRDSASWVSFRTRSMSAGLRLLSPPPIFVGEFCLVYNSAVLWQHPSISLLQPYIVSFSMLSSIGISDSAALCYGI